MKKIGKVVLFFSLLGLADAGYLAYQHYTHIIPPCKIGSLFDCGTVLTSSYAYILNVPVSVWGILHYSILFFTSVLSFLHKNKIWFYFFSFFSLVGFLFSVYFVYIQIIILKTFCFYCMLSAINSFIIFILLLFIWVKKARL